MILALTLLLAQSPQDRWREAIDLDLPGEVVDAALPLVTGSGALARDGRALGLAARALAATGAGDRAQKLLDGAHPDEGSRGFVEVARARLALDRDQLARAREMLLASADEVRYPQIDECWLLAGRALARSGDAVHATPLFERFLGLAPLDAEAPSAWHALAQAAIARGDTAGATELRRKALASAQWQAFYKTRRLQVRENPGEPLPRLGIAELLLAVGENARARDAAAEITARWPEFCRGHEALGRSERALGHLAEARTALERACACDASSARAVLELARVLAASGEKDAAAARYARYRELGGTEPLESR
ncbi:MAG TPA: hypothetical protein VGR31_02625 [Planctomycetota bacterium]|jgi:tetratricopeptide (TPR) repeat protein|nr:hypothetical protein [Planctomycetota bacterium]